MESSSDSLPAINPKRAGLRQHHAADRIPAARAGRHHGRRAGADPAKAEAKHTAPPRSASSRKPSAPVNTGVSWCRRERLQVAVDAQISSETAQPGDTWTGRGRGAGRDRHRGADSCGQRGARRHHRQPRGREGATRVTLVLVGQVHHRRLDRVLGPGRQRTALIAWLAARVRNRGAIAGGAAARWRPDRQGRRWRAQGALIRWACSAVELRPV